MFSQVSCDIQRNLGDQFWDPTHSRISFGIQRILGLVLGFNAF